VSWAGPVDPPLAVEFTPAAGSEEEAPGGRRYWPAGLGKDGTALDRPGTARRDVEAADSGGGEWGRTRGGGAGDWERRGGSR
jgi:hypothetical protein